MSSCTDPETGKLSDNACDLCANRNVSIASRSERSRQEIKEYQAKRKELRRKRKTERLNRGN